jgi:hypothetical protein
MVSGATYTPEKTPDLAILVRRTGLDPGASGD